MRQRSIVDQMIHIEECIKNQKTIQVINIPVGWTPNDLIRHYTELYNILDEAKGQPEYLLKAWLGGAKTRRATNFTTTQEIEILEELTK